MGGKHKGQAQRTKNNTKASTSGRSAELLNSNVKILPGFSNVIQEDFSSLVMSKIAMDDVDPAMSADYQLVIKKMGKKDPTTKLKALQEFSALVEKSEVSEVTPILPIWSKVYPTLSLDTEHRVREAAQVSHGAVVIKCGRALAPHLKQLAPAWLMSQYDTFAPAATQAQASLKNVFPSSKLPDVISFCRIELLSTISKNLLIQTPSGLANAKSCTAEESEAVYQRMVIASLQGFALMLKHLPGDHFEWFCQQQDPILKNNSFWKLASHKNPQIRSAWYVTIGCLCDKQSSWFGEKYASKTLQILIKNLNEEDSTVAPNIWDCLLMLMAVKHTWSNDTVIDKIITDQLCCIVSNAGHGIATKLSPVLLPLLAHLPASLRTQDFYNQFFKDFLKGMEQRSITSSKIEGTAWVSGLSECLRFVSIENEMDFANQLVPSIVRLWLQKAIHLRKTQNSHHLFKHSVLSVASLARFWTKQSLSNPSLHYSQIIRLFWKNLHFVFSSEMENVDISIDAIKCTTDVHIELIAGLKTSFEEKKQAKVKFSDDSDPVLIVKAHDLAANNTEYKINDTYDHDLLNFVCEIASVYLKFATTKCIAAPMLMPLYSILSEFDKVEIYHAMAHALFPETTDVKLIQLYTDLWHKWLTGDSMRCQSIIELTFHLLKYLEPSDQRTIFNAFNQFIPSVVEMCISKCLCYPYSSNPVVKDWLNGDVVSESLVATCKHLIKEGDRKKATLLKMCFTEDNDGEILIGDKACAAIINTMSQSLPTIPNKHLDMCASFASQLAFVSIKDKSIKTNLLLSMITLNCTLKAGSEHISADTWWEVNIAWQGAIQSPGWGEDDILTLITATKKVMKQALHDGDLIQNDVITNMAADLIMSLVTISLPENRLQAVRNYYEQITGLNDVSQENKWQGIFYQSVIFDIISGYLNIPFASNNSVVESVLKNSSNVYNENLQHEDLKDYMVHFLFAAKLVHRILISRNINKSLKSQEVNELDGEDNELDEEVNELDEECYAPDSILWTSNVDLFGAMQKYATDLLHHLMVLESLLKSHQMWQYHEILSTLYPKLEILQIEVLKSISADESRKQKLTDFLQLTSDANGLYWSKALSFYHKHVLSSDANNESGKNADNQKMPSPETQQEILSAIAPKSIDSFNGSGFFHNLQASINMQKDAEPLFVVSVAGVMAVRCLYLSDLTGQSLTITNDNIDECFSQTFGCLNLIIEHYYKNKTMMLFERDITECSWVSLQLNVAILKYLEYAVKYYGWHLNNIQWDFITISISFLMKSLQISLSKWRSLKWSALSCAVFSAYNEIRTFIKSIHARCLSAVPSDTVIELPEEWRDVFEPDLHKCILIINLHIFDDYLKNAKLELTTKEAYVIAQIGSTIDNAALKHPPGISFDAVMKSCVNVLCSTRHHSLKYTAYKLLNTLVSSLIENDNSILNSLSEGCEEGTSLPKLSLHKIEPPLVQIQELLVISLSPFKICEDSCSFEPFTDSYNIALGYLLLWDFINKMSTIANGDLFHQYAEFLKTGKYIEHFCTNAFKMLPEQIIRTIQMDTQLQAKFDSSIEIKYNDSITPSLLSSAACSVLFGVMAGTGAGAVRDWWILQDSERVIDRIVSTYISPQLNNKALQTVQQKAPQIKDAQIRIHWSTFELMAVHSVEGKDFELNIKLPANNPLTKPKVVCTGVAANHTNWLTMFLSYQHGSLWEAICMWVGSLQKKIEGSAMCYICYCRLQPTTGQLTKFTCYTCKNKYHTTCLYKWFRQSSKNTCPLCRKQF